MSIFNEVEKAATMCLLVKMINIDSMVDAEEVDALNGIIKELHVSADIFELGKGLKLEYACDIISKMDDDKKLIIAKHLVSIIDANNVVDEYEIALFNKICEKTGIDIILNQDKE